MSRYVLEMNHMLVSVASYLCVLAQVVFKALSSTGYRNIPGDDAGA
jgi:hypothetical protein